MRKSTLMAVAYVIVFPFVYFAENIFFFGGFPDLPRGSLAGKGVVAFVVAGIVSVILTPLNRRILDWRRARGRDIEEEERYESDYGMISLTPKDDEQKK